MSKSKLVLMKCTDCGKTYKVLHLKNPNLYVCENCEEDNMVNYSYKHPILSKFDLIK
jgi:hypothetical protein